MICHTVADPEWAGRGQDKQTLWVHQSSVHTVVRRDITDVCYCCLYSTPKGKQTEKLQFLKEIPFKLNTLWSEPPVSL